MGSLIVRGFNGSITRDHRSEPSMITPGQTLENPVTGERFTFTHTAASTGGELLAFELALRPGASVPIPHVHPIQTERFEVLSGTMRFRVGWRHRLAGAGDVVEVAPGVMHGFANIGDHEARLRVEVRPALAMEDMFAEVIAMAEAGRMTSRGLPRNPLELADLARRYDQEAHAPLMSVGVQRLLLAPFVHYRQQAWSDSGRSSSRFASTRSSRFACPIAPSARLGSPTPA
jgi:quercetin dioxygenase-like cupin family protein